MPDLDIHDLSKNYDIYPTETATRRFNFNFVPGIALSNVMSITPKIDEIRSVVLDLKIDIAAFTETWLRDSIQDTIIDIPGYQIYRKDRNGGLHGGVCTYVRDGIRTTILNDLHRPTLEVLWIKLRPKRLPRGVPSIIVGTIYHPLSIPSSDNQAMINYLIETLTSIEANNPNCGIIVMADLNRLNIFHINRQFKLKQLVKFNLNYFINFIHYNIVSYGKRGLPHSSGEYRVLVR